MAYTDDYKDYMEQANNEGKIYVFGSFDNEMGNFAIQQVKNAIEGAQKMGKNHVLFIFDSSGGMVSTLQRYLGAMQLFKPQDFFFVGFVACQAYSAACDLLQYMDWRIASAHSNILVHYGQTGLNNWDQGMLYQNSKEALKFEKTRNKAFLEMYSKRSGMAVSEVHKLCIQNAPLNAHQALKYGLVDEIVDSLPAKSFRPDYTLN